MAKNKVGRPTNRSRSGRPTSFTPEVIQKLEDAFAMGATDGGACLYAGIAQSSLYNYQKENPSFVERKTLLKHKPVLKALNTVVSALSDPHHARWYLERKHEDFKDKKEVKHTITHDPETKKELDEAIESIFE